MTLATLDLQACMEVAYKGSYGNENHFFYRMKSG